MGAASGSAYGDTGVIGELASKGVVATLVFAVRTCPRGDGDGEADTLADMENETAVDERGLKVRRICCPRVGRPACGFLSGSIAA